MTSQYLSELQWSKMRISLGDGETQVQDHPKSK